MKLTRPPLVGAPGTPLQIATRVKSTIRVEKIRAYSEGRLLAEVAVCKASGEVVFEISGATGDRIAVFAVDATGGITSAHWRLS